METPSRLTPEDTRTRTRNDKTGTPLGNASYLLLSFPCPSQDFNNRDLKEYFVSGGASSFLSTPLSGMCKGPSAANLQPFTTQVGRLRGAL